MKKAIFIFLILSLLFPFIQEEFQLFKLKALSGVTTDSAKPEFSINKWLSGEFQNNYNEYKNETFGLRNWFIFFFNQMDFTIFSKTHVDVLVGKNGYLFQQSYIDEVTGKNFIGNDAMKKNIERIKRVENYFNKKNIFLMTVLAPGKTDYYKEYLPDYYSRQLSKPRNYNALLKYTEESNIRLLDFNKWTMQIKDTSKLLLFPKQGIHWNFYCMALCADSMVKYIEANTDRRLRDFSWTLEFPDSLRGTDYDLGGLLNIFEKLPFDKMPYPKFLFDDDLTASKPKLLVIADSFYWTIFNEQIYAKIFSNETYFYYYSSIFPGGRTPSDYTSDLDILTEVEKFDVVLLLQSSGNYGNPGVKFVQALDLELDRLDQFTTREVRNIIESEKLLDQARLISDSLKISQDSAQIILAENRVRKYFTKLSEVKIQMRTNPEWIRELYEKSDRQNKAIEQIMEADAEWIIKQEENKK